MLKKTKTISWVSLPSSSSFRAVYRPHASLKRNMSGCPFIHTAQGSSSSTQNKVTETDPPKHFADMPSMDLSEIMEEGGFTHVTRVLLRMRAKCGDIARGSAIKNTDMVYVFEPSEIKKIIDNEGKYPFSIGAMIWPMAKVYEEHGIRFLGFMSGEEWRDTRTIVQKGLSTQKEAATYFPVIHKEISDALNLLPKYAADMDTFCSMLAVELTAASIFGQGVGVLNGNGDEADYRFLSDLQNVTHLTQKMMWVDPSSVDASEWTTMHDSMGRMIDHTRTLIARSLKRSSSSSPSYLMSLMRFVKNGTITERQAADIIIGLYHAGSETTSSTMQWLIYNLAREPRVQISLFEECSRILEDGRQMTVDDIDKMPYMHCVLQESMRVTPTVCGSSRVLPTPIVLGGYEIPAWTPMMLLPYPIAMDPKVFHDPERFIPERYIGKRERRIDSKRNRKCQAAAVESNSSTALHRYHDSPMVHMPFSRGKRMCPGSQLARIEAFSLLSQLPRKWRLSFANRCVDPKPEKICHLTIRPSPSPHYSCEPVSVC